jgi:hypothetical protein
VVSLTRALPELADNSPRSYPFSVRVTDSSASAISA